MGDDHADRRTFTVSHALPWVREVVETADALVRVRAGRGVLDRRARERLMLAVAEVEGCRTCAFVHGAWAEFLGDTSLPDAEAAVVDFARACAEAGRPLDTAVLAPLLPPAARREVRLSVATVELSSMIDNTWTALAATLTGRRRFDPARALGEIVVAGIGLRLAARPVATAAVVRQLARWAPEMPEVTMPPAGKANLLTHLLAEAAPAYLANAGVRSVVLGLPFGVSVGVRAGRTTATVSVGRGRVEVRNGIARDAMIVVEGEVEPLLRIATGELVREFGSIRIRPNS